LPSDIYNQLLNLNLKPTTKIVYHLHHLKFNYEMYLITGQPAHCERKNIFSPFCRWPTYYSPRLLWWCRILKKHRTGH